jgi:hypothetical protein
MAPTLGASGSAVFRRILRSVAGNVLKNNNCLTRKTRKKLLFFA